MPDTTPGYGFPYATGTDPLADGAASMQAMAQAIEDHLVGCSARLARLGTQGIANTVDEWIAWNDATLSAEFSLDGALETITYTGPDRYVAWAWSLTWAADPGPSWGALVNAALPLDRSLVSEMIAAPEWFSNSHSGIVWMASGSSWRLKVKQASGGSLAVTPKLDLKGL